MKTRQIRHFDFDEILYRMKRQGKCNCLACKHNKGFIKHYFIAVTRARLFYILAPKGSEITYSMPGSENITIEQRYLKQLDLPLPIVLCQN